MERLRVVVIGIFALLMVIMLPQTTIAITVAGSNPNDSMYSPTSFFDGVVTIETVASDGHHYFASGALINTIDPNHGYILTAAHVLTNDANFNVSSWKVTFLPNGGSPITFLSTDPGAASFWPNTWNGIAFGVNSNGSDIGLIRLGSPVTGIAGYKLLSGDNFIFGNYPPQWGTVATIAGYGISGTGATGVDLLTYGFGTLRVGENKFDAEWITIPGSPYGFDFDNGLEVNDVWGQLFGGQWIDTGLGLDEILTAPGDSGGPSFVINPITNNTVLAGVHSFGYTFGAPTDVDTIAGHEPNSSFGEAAGDTRVVAYLDWIDSVIAVPEPCTMILILIGSGMLGLAGLRRKFKK